MSQRGFTLIELVVVLILVGIMAFVAIPRFNLLRGFDETGYRDQVKATFEFARKAAVAQRRTVQVSISSSAVTVEVQRQTPEGEGTAALAPLSLPGQSSNSILPPAGVSLSPASATITFDASGRPNAGASFTVSGGGGSITLEAETGYVH